MKPDLEKDLVIGISSTALFDLRKEDEIYKSQGLKAYCDYQIEHEEDVLEPGTGFHLVKMLLKLNSVADSPRRVTVIVMSRNSADTSLRIFNSIKHHGLSISRAVLSGGEPLSPYMRPFRVDLFLSTHKDDVREALANATAAAVICDPPDAPDVEQEQIRIAFDGDAVLFSDQAERIYQEKGLDAFAEHERENAARPLPDGPFAKLFRGLVLIQSKFEDGKCPIRTALVTARDSPAHERAIRTFRAWGARVDQAFFLGGLPKHEIVRAFRPHIFFDDNPGYCESASRLVPTGLVPASVRDKNEDEAAGGGRRPRLLAAVREAGKRLRGMARGKTDPSAA